MTFRPLLTILFASIALLVSHGCTSLVARRAIMNFADSLESQDLDQIRVATSNEFESKALRRPEAISDLKLLRMPKGDVRVVSVDEIDETTKLATVEIGEDEFAKTVDYRLALDKETGRWVVDDVILNQDDPTGREIRRSVTDQMDLLLSCREVLNDWEAAPRTVKLQHCTDELHAELSTLPPSWLNRLATEMVGSGRSMNFRPDARVSGERAVVVVPHEKGKLFVEFRKVRTGWKVDNLSIETNQADSGEVRALLAEAKILNNSARFLTSFSENDLDKVKNYASKEFFSQSLTHGDMSTVSIPVAALIADEYEMNSFGDGAQLLLEAGESTYMLTVRVQDADVKGAGIPQPRVDEVTIFSGDGTEVKKVSSMLLSTSVVELYVKALQSRSLEEIRSMSSNDFNERVWKSEAAQHFRIMPFPQIEPGPTDVLATVFRGDITEITVAQGNTPMTFYLRLGDGWMVVDDVLLPSHNRPVSLKQNLELLLPIYAFASALNRRDVAQVSQYSGSGLNQIIWRQLNYVPEMTREMVRPLMSEVTRITPTETWTTVQTSDGVVSSEIKLSRVGQRYVIEDIILTNEASPSRQFALLQSTRQQIAAGQLLPKGANIQRAHYEAPATAPVASPVQQATFEPISPEVYRR